MTKILMVCHGNICRSPMAEFVFRDMAAKAGVEVEVASAATSAEEIGNTVYPPVRRLLLEHGLDPSGKTARQLRRSEYGDWDLIVGMDSANIRNMNRIFGGDPAHKVHRLLDFSDHPRDIADPWYTGNFDVTYDDIVEGCEALLAYLEKKGEIRIP